jgi:hypothetical protein
VTVGFARGFVAVTLVAGCAGYTRGMRPDEKPSPDAAYVYGRFSMRTGPLAVDTYETMGFVIGCDDGRTYTIRFFNTGEVQVIEVHPSRCALEEVVYIESDGSVHGRARPPGAWVRGTAFAAGRAYYLGDYLAVARHRTEYIGRFEEHKWVWEMNQVDDRYESTTSELRRAFANLASLSTEDRRLVPRR